MCGGWGYKRGRPLKTWRVAIKMIFENLTNKTEVSGAEVLKLP